MLHITRWILVVSIVLLPAIPGYGQPERTDIEWEDYWKTQLRIDYGRNWPMESVYMNGHRQLFVDDAVIEYMENVQKKLHQPRKFEANPVIPCDKPWEGEVTFGSVIREPDGQFRFWYFTASGICYATSPDGIHWEKPALRMHEYVGSVSRAREYGMDVPEGAAEFRTLDNNIVIPRPGGGSPTVIRDAFEQDPAKRYKFFSKYNEPVYGIYVAYSPDGLHWTFREEPVLTPENDPGLNDRPTMFQDTAKKRYIASLKREMTNPFGSGDYGIHQRMRAIAVSEDFEHWSDPVLTLATDEQDPRGLQIYGHVGFNYEGLYLGFMDMFWATDLGPKANALDVQLAVSRDGVHWWRAGNRETFIPLGADDEWDRLRVYPCSNPPIPMGDDLWIYYRGKANRHRPPPPEHRREFPWFAPRHPEDRPLPPGVVSNSVGLAILRRDGFVSMDAGSRPGMLVTKPLVFEGGTVHLNADAADGYIRAEVYVAEFVEGAKVPAWNWRIDSPAEGFTLEDCTPFEQDTTDGTITWTGGKLNQFEGKKIVLRFQLSEASMYSFWIE